MLDLNWNHATQDAWNAADLNRIESACVTLRDALYASGYTVSMLTKTDWTRTDRPTQSQIDRIRRNVDALQTGFYSLPDWRDIVYNGTMNAAQANALEWDLHAIETWLNRMLAAVDWRRSGEIYAGEGII